MSSITMAGDSEDDARRFDSYQKLLQLAASYEDTIGTVPQMAVVGIESHGKSSLVQAYVGFPCTFIGGGTATRCPVEYTLINDASTDEPLVEYCKPQGEFVEIHSRELETMLAKHMRSLGSGFSSQPVRVRVRSKDCVNIVLLDLPGIIINPAEGKEADKRKVDEIVQFYASQPSNFLLLVEKSVPSANSEALPKEMKRLVEFTRPTWAKECLMIATMFDQQIKGGNLSSIENARDFYKSSQHPNQPRKHYVSLLPRPQNSDAIEHIRRQIHLEQELVDNWIREISLNAGPGEVFPTEFLNQIGLKLARAAIQDKFYELISTTGVFSRLRQKLRDNKLHYESEVKRRRKLLDGVMNGGNLRTSVDNLTRSFLSGLHNIFQYTNAMRKSFEPRCLNFYQEIDARLQEKLGEYDPAPVPFEPEWRRRLMELCKEDEFIYTEVISPLIGSTQINRATMVFKYLVLSAQHEDWSDPGLQKRVFGHLAGNPSTKTNYDKGIRELVKGGITDNLTQSSYLRWYIDHVEWILRHHGNMMMQHILDNGNFGDLKDSQVPSQVLENYFSGVKALMIEINSLFTQVSWVHSQYIAHMQVAELVEILDAIPRADRANVVVPPKSPFNIPIPSYNPSGKAQSSVSTTNVVPTISENPEEDEEEDDDEFEDSPTPYDANKPNGPTPDPKSKPGTSAIAYSSSPGIVPKAPFQTLGFGRSTIEIPPHTGLPAPVISAVCNRKFEGTPAVALPSTVCAWVRETYFFNLILMMRHMEFLVNSMVVLELNGDVDRRKTIDQAIYSVLRLDEEQLNKLRDFNLVEIAEKQKVEEELLERLTIDHKTATEAIAILEQPRTVKPIVQRLMPF